VCNAHNEKDLKKNTHDVAYSVSPAVMYGEQCVCLFEKERERLKEEKNYAVR
jgi:hypothetical protein